MGTLRSIYVRFNDSVDLARLQDRLDPGTQLATEPAFSFAEIPWNDFQAPSQLIEDLSRDLQTDVLWLAFQSVVDAFAFEHWRNGICGRRLIFGCFDAERTWEQIEGDAEAWESEALESPQIGHFGGSVDGRETARAVAAFYQLPRWS